MITTREDLGISGASVDKRVPLLLGDLIPEVNVTPLCRTSLNNVQDVEEGPFLCASNFWLQQHLSYIDCVLLEHV